MKPTPAPIQRRVDRAHRRARRVFEGLMHLAESDALRERFLRIFDALQDAAITETAEDAAEAVRRLHAARRAALRSLRRSVAGRVAQRPPRYRRPVMPRGRSRAPRTQRRRTAAPPPEDPPGPARSELSGGAS